MFENELLRVAPTLGLHLSEKSLEKLKAFFDLLVEQNKVMNLTRITDECEAALRHFADSLSASIFIQKNAKVLDVGTGGGFPGMPLAICREDLDITMIDSREKKIRFVKQAAQELDIGNASAFHARAEEAAHKSGLRESFDIVVSRAVANMETLSEYCLPFLKSDGKFIAWKGKACEDELDKAKPHISLLGGVLQEIYAVPLEGFDLKLAIINKTSQTPSKYPRKLII